jgi:acetolactate synthase I/II/III large subunit
MKQTTGEVIVASLLRHGVDTIFGVPGAQTYDLFEALYQASDKIRMITVRHEQAAAYMAFGYARSTGKVGVFTVVPGPGVLNTMAALCTALGCNVPVVCLTGQVPSAFLGKGRGHLHELPDQLATLRSMLKWAERIERPEDAADKVFEAFKQAQSGRPGPVSLETCWDVLGQQGEITLPEAPYELVQPSVNEAEIAAAADLIAKAKRPMIYVGGGALEAAEEVKELAERLGAPVSSQRAGRGVMDEDHPLTFSLPCAYQVWPETDLLIGIGSRLEGPYMRWAGMQWVDAPGHSPDNEGPTLIRIDIDAQEMARFKPHAGIVADAKAGTRALIKALVERGTNFEDRSAQLAETKKTTWEAMQEVQPQISYLDVIREELPRNGFFVEELTQAGFTSTFGFAVHEPRTFVTCGYQGTLGFGFPTALGVKFGNPDKAVVSICGDGGFMFGVQELATAAQYGIGLVTIVFNNSAFGNVKRDQQTRYDGHFIGSELQNPDFVALADSFGVDSYWVDRPEDLQKSLKAALAKDVPALIEVKTDQASETSPWKFIVQRK